MTKFIRLLGIISLGFICAFISFSGADMEARGKMAAMAQIPIDKVVTHFNKSPKSEAAILTQVAQKVGVESISVIQGGSVDDALQRVDAVTLVNAIQMRISSFQSWEPTLKGSSLTFVKAHRSLIEKSLDSKSHGWAWFLFQLDDLESAKKLLLMRYNEGFEHVMKLKTATYGFGGTPLSGVEMDLRALQALCSGAEKTDLKDKMSKMKIHVSKLPESHIVT